MQKENVKIVEICTARYWTYSAPFARANEPAVWRVQITTRNLYINSSGGNINEPSLMLQFFLNLACKSVVLYDFAYILKSSESPKTFRRRPATSSQAEFEFAHTRTLFFVERTICSINATNVRVFPVPLKQKRKYLIFNIQILESWKILTGRAKQ